MVHLILLLPIAGLALFWMLPISTALPAYLVLLAVSAWLYYVTLKAMRRPTETGLEGLIGKPAIVIAMNGHQGQVSVEGEIWEATSDDALRKGDTARITRISGLTLEVQHATPALTPQGTKELA